MGIKMSRGNILVIDDEIDHAIYVAEIAQAAGFDAEFSDDSRSLEEMFSNDPCIVVLDLFMPKIDGIEILRFLGRRQHHPAIILVSGKDKRVLNSARELTTELGLAVLGILEKPFLLSDLEPLLDLYTLDNSNSPRRTGPVRPKPEPVSPEALRTAIEEGALTVAYQPQFRMSDRRPVGVEALARWEHSEYGSVSPGVFIPLAEEHDLIIPLTHFVMEQALRQQAALRAVGHDLGMSINFSAKSLDDLDLPEKLYELANNVGADVNKITVEVTETVIMSNVAKYMDILTRLRIKGFGLSLDDFGTGYSSLYQLVRIPFTELKVDRVFVGNMKHHTDCAIVSRISTLLAHELGIEVVAEGVEKEEDWSKLRQMRCDRAQGFLMARPMTSEALGVFLEESLLR